MVEQLLEHRRFSYEDWVQHFREDDRDPPPFRADRKFFSHLKFVKERALPVLGRGSSFILECDEHQVYHLRGDRGEVLELNDEAWANYFPLFYAMNQRRSLVPFPVRNLERQLEEAFDPPEALKGRVIYKNRFSGRFQKDHIVAFYEAVQEGVLLEAEQAGRPQIPFLPLFLLNYDGNWYVIGQAQGRLQQYNLSRVQAVRKTSLRGAVSPQDLETLRRRIQEVHGIHLLPAEGRRGEPWLVTIRYRGTALMYATERFDPGHRHPNDPWFEVFAGPDWLEVRLKTHDFSPLVSEALSWGADAEPLSPPEFRQLWQDKVRALAGLVSN